MAATGVLEYKLRHIDEALKRLDLMEATLKTENAARKK
jgi:hypothetical protein